MKKLEIVGYRRANLGRKHSQDLRAQGYVPGVLYGGTAQHHFYAPNMLFRELLTSGDVFEVTLNIEGDEYQAILQETQFHPVNDSLLHADFLEILPGKEVKVDVPIKLTGIAKGVTSGGKLNQKLRKLRVQGMAADIPDYIELNVSSLELGKSMKVSAIAEEGFTTLSQKAVPVVSVDVPRALRGGGLTAAEEAEADEADDAGENTEGETPAAE
ncbi:50S ribosomal protein L25/general stress protein Ctc [Persicitalea jodogahamensis]|uniref:Large ribosomal subunit protein bL25 n=1 Tax=Persicitalea jodogahamensis TaxID=402147 RepID=A0A8J3D4I2_9BACT|nr:50S ribosomal protein L25/general stress protein Ctc [Persicitalea jodogahamensis]GHB81761.1 50S ribosomal protein L25 [Persicitalea jodogahamensis]